MIVAAFFPPLLKVLQLDIIKLVHCHQPENYRFILIYNISIHYFTNRQDSVLWDFFPPPSHRESL